MMRRAQRHTGPGRRDHARRSALATVLGTALAIAGCDSLPGRPREADRPLAPTQVTDFAVLWGENCSGCHGADGKLGSSTPLGDPVYLAAASDVAIRDLTLRGIPGTPMPAFGLEYGGTLTDHQVDLLTRGMRARWASDVTPPPPPIDAAATGDAARGATVWQASCAGCHGTDGDGGAKGGSVVDPSWLSLTSDRALRTAVVVGRPDLGMPDWRGEGGARPLDAEQVSDVVAWIAARRPAPIALPGAAAPAAGPSAPTGATTTTTTTARSEDVP